MRTTRIGWALAVLALVAAALAGCGSGHPTTTTRPAGADNADNPDRDAIRHFDFADARWHHWYLNSNFRRYTMPGDPTITLSNGTGHGRGAYGSPVTCSLAGSPVYGDLGDGMLSAAVALHCETGNGTSEAWSVWRWDRARHTAYQMPQPFAESARCGDVVESVRYQDGSFVVDGRGIGSYSGPCSDADAHRGPMHYAVALRHGYLMRVKPVPSSLRECLPATVNARPEPADGITLWATRDTAAPVVLRTGATVTLWRAASPDTDEGSTDLGGDRDRRWQFVRVTTRAGTTYCGYVPHSAPATGTRTTRNVQDTTGTHITMTDLT